MQKQTLLPLLFVSLLAACGEKEQTAPSPAAAPTTSVPSAPVAGGDFSKGEAVYKKTCALCHAAGVAGAPKPGDKADWGPRIAQGDEVLHQHAIKGFTGSKGMMPPKGGNAALSDEEVKAAVDYMVAQSK